MRPCPDLVIIQISSHKIVLCFFTL
jgi:hypothetical protein